jgi:hypothetical protein
MPPKIEISMFLKNKNFYVFTVWIFNTITFYISFLYYKIAFVCEFQHIPLRKMMFFSMFRTSCMRFWGHVSNSLRNKNMERYIPYLLLKMVFLAFKTLLSP